MATRTTSGDSTRTTGNSVSLDHGRRDARLSTETKAAPKTTEFMAYLAVLVGLLIAGIISDNDGAGGFGAQDVWLYATILTVGYMISRGLAKSGSRDPYWSGGTNQNRDND